VRVNSVMQALSDGSGLDMMDPQEWLCGG
jgi:hypothetical protein